MAVAGGAVGAGVSVGVGGAVSLPFTSAGWFVAQPTVIMLKAIKTIRNFFIRCLLRSSKASPSGLLTVKRAILIQA
jgi:hypothetical protein